MIFYTVSEFFSLIVSYSFFRNHFSSVSVLVFTSFRLQFFYECTWQFNYQTTSSSL